MRIVLATENRHKVEELADIFSGYQLLLPSQIGVDYHHDETGDSFLANAMGKARSLSARTELPVVADDSGLVVPALGGEPGIYSARYGSDIFGRPLETVERNNYLLERMGGIENRRAFFVCCMVLQLSDDRFFVAQETVEGGILHEPRGLGGFGYDPLFFLPDYGKAVAELPESEKNRISHRGRAGRRIRAVLDSLE
ncbi:MAG TPA: RdgB/HAM1 family non-canonical purine NTP pyrophosphatase [Sediminispirochaeta sp.]|mgnify:CR=1 FL=1|nr:RdgB/HAM1 family non-canonical purine NTP pyrophosphatase [Sediminispirochaeta sp.]